MANTEKKITTAEIKARAKEEVFSQIRSILEGMNMEMVGSTAYIPRMVEGQEIWVEVKLTAKNNTATKRGDAFDPFVAREAYEEDQRVKAENRSRKAKEKAEAKAAKEAAKSAQ